ncbi:HPF/RaiA family ribosome-associated protein [Pleurocapsa sp. PCC 7319]|uniref:HPF/RaiA family ribosome-associated protein n=1 Tax=Pleurocapsa sp. PCC 7319 TaxID=118161 RepID=UPI00034AED46|nr:HPF/RaiA family ribosome-associated protein [Pleurocapsa sp. PCC 7319]
MQIAPEITYRNIEKTDAIDSLIREKITKLEKFCDYMNSCRVVVEKAHKHPDSGSPYKVSIDITIPHGREIAVSHNPDRGKQYPPLEVVIRDAFEAARRQVVGLSTEQKGIRKTHPEQEISAVITKLFPEQGYGFLKAIDTGEEVYFHRNSVVNEDFAQLEVGNGIRFKATQGEMGLQATTVQIIDRQSSASRSEFVPESAEKPMGWN